MNDRVLRNVVIGLGGTANGVPRQDGYMITAASEVSAIFALAQDRADLEQRLASIVVGYDFAGKPVRAGDLRASGAMNLLLKNAISPNLVQTLEGTPAFVHGGPFGNIAHGCNSLIATQAGLALGDIVVTEAGFGADLGAEKFFDIKCRFGNLEPAAAIIVATVRALKLHGGVALKDLAEKNIQALQAGFANLERHVENVRKFGVPPLVALNRFANDSDEEVEAALELCRNINVPAAEADVHAQGGAGALELSDLLLTTMAESRADFRPLYPLELSLKEKIERVAVDIYGGMGVVYTSAAERDIARLEEIGLKEVPVCIAKTQYSFTDDPKRRGRPSGFFIHVREVTPSAGAGFVVVHTGDIMTMPGLPKKPAAEDMKISEDGKISGLF